MKTKIVFVVSSVNDSHYKNRILEFINRGYDVEVYGYERPNKKGQSNYPYPVNVLGVVRDKGYKERIGQYIKDFKVIKRQYKTTNVFFYLCGLDMAIGFTLFSRGVKYIYEECDLVHTYTKLKKILEVWDKHIIKNSMLTITTSEGFVKYHWGSRCPSNVCLVENKLNPELLNFKKYSTCEVDLNNLSIGFVGAPRFMSVYNFIRIFCENFPQYTFHIFGGPVSAQFETLKCHKNCIFHGFFKNPDDLSEIYSQIDLVLSTYDVKYENVRYAEPNKLYESIYFETPIIVSSGTYLAEKVDRLGVGFAIDAMSEEEVITFIRNLAKDKILNKIQAAKSIDKKCTLNINDHMFERLKSLKIV